MSTTLSTVVLTSKGEVRKANLSLRADGTLTLDAIKKYIKKKEDPELIGTWEDGAQYLNLFGYKKGKKGTENKTEVPFPHSDTTLYGDAVVVACLDTWEQPIPYTAEKWSAFYERVMDGEEKKEDEEEEEEEEKEAEEEEEEEEKEVDEEEDELEIELEGPEELEEVEPEPEVVPKRKRGPLYQKIDTSTLKDDIAPDSTADSHSIRTLCLRHLSFLEEESFSKEEILSLEKAIFEATLQYAERCYVPRNWRSPTFCEAYRQIVRTVFSNLHPKSPVNNPRLLLRVREGEFPLEAIPFMSAYEIYPENWFALKDKLLQREQKILEGNKSRATDQFKCRRCQKKECTYYELQTRSADEPMTIFITCLNCGKEWRQGG